MNSPDIVEVLLKILNVFQILQIEYQIGGSLASSAFGIPRTTLDIDIVADIKPQHIVKIVNLLKKEFYIDKNMIEEAVKNKSTFNLIYLKTMFKIDVFVLNERLYDQQSFSRRIYKAISEDETQKVYFTTPEDIILIKLEWFRSGGEISERQWSDVIGVLKVQKRQLDMNYLNKWAKELGVSDLLKKALKEAGRG